MKNLENTYRSLPSNFWQDARPTAATNPTLIQFNQKLANELGLTFDSPVDVLKIFSGIEIPDNLSPLAMAYSGHQFGHFSSSLGDGRAILLGEVKSKENIRYDIQLKGAGRTPYSRGGDGKSSLGPVIREYILSEAMNNLNVPTTRSLCAVLSGDNVFRDEELPGAIFTRVSKSHIRVGTFEYFSSRGLVEEVKVLADYLIDRQYSHLQNSKDMYLKLFREISKRKLDLVAKWMSIGFIHGVMNTDNTSAIGETIDYGPCAFMDYFEFDKVYSSIDRNSRYAYNNQGQIAQWNLTSLANCFIPLIDEDGEKSVSILREELTQLSHYFDQKWTLEMGKKLGIKEVNGKGLSLINKFLSHLQDNNLDFTNSFRSLPEDLENNKSHLLELKKYLEDQDQSTEESFKLMNSVNPSIIPRNHLVQKCIEDALQGNYKSFQDLNSALENPFQDNMEYEEFKTPPELDEVVQQTFCGT